MIHILPTQGASGHAGRSHFAEFARLVRPGGRYVLVTWCRNDLETANRDAIDAIDAHYVCHIHDRSHYFAMLARHHFVPLTVKDLTADAIPYWELRSHSRYATGVEAPFLTSLSSRELNYMVIITELSR
jgi:geranyl diphosphate 2-C-methyltransferase